MTDLLGIIDAGGPVIVVLLALSLLSLTLIAAKLIQLRGVRAGSGQRDAALKQWLAGERDAARAKLAAGTAPADRVTGTVMDRLLAGTPPPAVEAEAEILGNQELEAMNRHIRVLELVAMISPLLGLLGTVLGMIESFQQLDLAGGSANASVLAGGIWRALLTTAAGLLVAIPAAAAAALFSTRIEGAAQSIERTVGQLLVIERARVDAGPRG
ncbi:MotA/TolQ/ExbB proton channel family protein [Pararhodobacter sp. SW119]|uniref:MotA/TolQ/ExbB proton channel family protein n=1 Tax=Pararhodobacter sp. SW119 TaxID=2780075 RepID=UPI001AE02300